MAHFLICYWKCGLETYTSNDGLLDHMEAFNVSRLRLRETTDLGLDPFFLSRFTLS